MVSATPTEWEEIGAFIRNLSSWKSCADQCSIPTINVVQNPSRHFKDCLKKFKRRHGVKKANAIIKDIPGAGIGVSWNGRFNAKVVLSDEDAALLRMFYTDQTEMVDEYE